MSETFKPARPGGISWGTMRTQDLIPTFLDVLRRLESPHYEQFMTAPLPVIPSDAQIDEDHPWWDSDEAAYLLEDLFDALADHSPDKHYFGAHPGDGSNYGFWPISELGIEI